MRSQAELGHLALGIVNKLTIPNLILFNSGLNPGTNKFYQILTILSVNLSLIEGISMKLSKSELIYSISKIFVIFDIELKWLHPPKKFLHPPNEQS